MSTNKLINKAIFICIFTGLLAGSCDNDNILEEPGLNTADLSSEVITDWMDLLLVMSKETPGFTPPVAARAFGYIGLTAYESVRLGMPGYRSLQGQLAEFTPGIIPDFEQDLSYHWAIVANSALAEMARGCYGSASPENEQLINDLERKLNETYRSEISESIFLRSVMQGKSIGTDMLAFTNSDGQALCFKTNFPESYTPPAGEGLWEPTPPEFRRALQPYWGDVRPFLAQNISEVQPEAPPSYSLDPGSAFYNETIEVYNAVKNLTSEQRAIAEFWSDDPGSTITPPGHSLSILRQVLETENANLAMAAEAFAKLGIGLHDAFVSCWKSKYTFNLVRPISVIHAHIDPDFEIPLTTPPFPEYTSGHSVQSGAAAQILTDLFGSNYAFTDSTNASRSDIDNAPRTFGSFFDFADEAAISRLYGGIHYRAAIDRGLLQGKEIGKNVGSLRFK